MISSPVFLSLLSFTLSLSLSHANAGSFFHKRFFLFLAGRRDFISCHLIHISIYVCMYLSHVHTYKCIYYIFFIFFFCIICKRFTRSYNWIIEYFIQIDYTPSMPDSKSHDCGRAHTHTHIDTIIYICIHLCTSI